ncbi:MAG: thymidine kinase [Patescibacteria group bacterium]
MQEPILEVITGCMFSGKTEELIRRLRRLEHGSRLEDWTEAFLVILPTTKRREERNIKKIFRQRVHQISDPEEVFDLLSPTQRVVAFDEAHFLSESLADVVEKLVKSGRRVIVSGLNVTYTGDPWPTMARILCKAEDIYLCVAVCAKCGKNRAVRSLRLVTSRELILIGDKDEKTEYEPRCLACFEPPTD